MASPVRRLRPDERRPLIDHLEELRVRLWWCLVAVAAGGCVTYAVRERILAWLLRPVGHVVFTSLAEPFLAEFRLALWGGVVLGFPVILWQTWAFVAAALTDTQRRMVGRLFPFSLALFALGAWAGLTQFVPVSVKFFLSFSTETMVPMVTVSQYLGFVGSLTLACGLIAQTPLIIAFLAALGIVTPAFLWHHWRGAVVGSFVIAAVATPTPDIFTQTLLAVPLLGLYGLSIGLAACCQPKVPAPSLAAATGGD